MTAKTRKEQILEMLTSDPTDTMLRYMLAMEWVSEGKDDEAARCFAELLRQAPEYVPAYVQGGLAWKRLGQVDAARSCWQRGIMTARQQNDTHAAEEMQAMLAELE